MPSISLHSIASSHGSRLKKSRIGRGLGSGRGKTSGRGTKGQRSRTGGRRALKLKGLKQMLLSFPKLRGFQSRRRKLAAISLRRLEAMYADGATVTLETLREVGLITRSDRAAKIVGAGILTKKLTVQGISFTPAAKSAIEKAGGQVRA